MLVMKVTCFAASISMCTLKTLHYDPYSKKENRRGKPGAFHGVYFVTA